MADEEKIPVEEVKEEKTPKVPEVDYIFNMKEAERWLDNSSARVVNAYRSIRFEIEYLPPEHLGMLLTFISRAIKGEIVNRMGAVVGQGVLYIPEHLAKRDELSWLKKGEKVGKYVAFRR